MNKIVLWLIIKFTFMMIPCDQYQGYWLTPYMRFSKKKRFFFQKSYLCYGSLSKNQLGKKIPLCDVYK